MNMRFLMRLALCVALFGAAGAASALSYVMMRDEPLVDQADAIVRGTVVGTQSHINGAYETLYEIRVDDNFSPKSSQPTELLALPGTAPGATSGVHVDGVPKLLPGARVLVFAERRRDGTLVPLQLTLCLFQEETTSTGRFYTRSLKKSGDVGKANEDHHNPREAIRFERWILARARGQSQPVDYLVDEKTLGTRPKFNLFDSGGTPIRWFTFDTGSTVTWTATSGGQNGMTLVDEYALLQQALAAWTNDATSNIRLAYGGQGAVDSHCSGTNDGNRLLWNDPLSQIGGSFSCSMGGTLATGGPCFGGTATSGGRTYYRAAEARVTIQDGAECFFNGQGGKNGAEVITHELGHTLGFDHSCGDASSGSCVPGTPAAAATMRAQAHGDGRGAYLAPDDVAAAAYVYPGSGGTPPPPTTDAIYANGFE